MSFLNLWALWLAAALVPLLVLLYFLKLRRRTQTVPSTLLWKRAVQDLQVNAPFQRLRRNLLLLLQLLVLAAGILALARPVVRSPISDETSVILLIDRSASMSTREGQETRLDQAKEQARRLLRTLRAGRRPWWDFFGASGPAARVMLITFAERASVVAPFTTNIGEVIDAIDRIQPSDGATNLAEALDLAEAYLKQTVVEQTVESAEMPSRLVLISDGGVGAASDVALRAGALTLLPIGETQDNAAITSLRVQRSYEDPEQLSVFVQVENFGPAPIRSDVSLYVDGRLGMGRVQTIELGAARQRAGAESQPADVAAPTDDLASAGALSFEFPLAGAGEIEARLSRDDPLAVDNRAYAIVPAPRKLSVLLVSPKNFFLESVLRNLPLERWSYLTPAQYEAAEVSELETDGRSNFDVVIFDRHSTDRLPVGNYFFLGATPAIPGIETAGELGWHSLQWWDETHPILRHVALEYVYVAKALRLKLPADAQMIIEGPQGPALARYSRDGRQYLILGFDVQDSTWWNKLGYPVFIYNAVRYLGSGAAFGEEDVVRPGDAIRIPHAAASDAAAVITPDGRRLPVRADAAGGAFFSGTERVGVYRVEPAPSEGDRFAVNLGDRIESNVRPRTDLSLGTGVEIDIGESVRTGTPEVWRWFALGALAILLFEWYVYNRRVMI